MKYVFFKRLIKAIENAVLRIDSFRILTPAGKKKATVLPCVSLATKRPSRLMRYFKNSEHDVKNAFINDQGSQNSSVSKLFLGCYSMDFNGCEAIAVCNALKLMGRETSLSEIVYRFEMLGAVTRLSFFAAKKYGYFGSNPFSIGRVLRSYGLNYEKVKFSDLGKEGVYILSYWNSLDAMSALHTVAVKSHGDSFEVYNLGRTKRMTLDLDFAEHFIAGYRIK